MRSALTGWVSMAAVMLMGCGGQVVPVDSASEVGSDAAIEAAFDTASDRGSDTPVTDVGSGTDTMDASVLACPSVEPTTGASCPVEGANCTYGSDPAFHCRNHANC